MHGAANVVVFGLLLLFVVGPSVRRLIVWLSSLRRLSVLCLAITVSFLHLLSSGGNIQIVFSASSFCLLARDRR